MTNHQFAILFADVSGSSSLYKAVGDERARALVTEAVARMLHAVSAHEGTLVKTIGDEVMARFPTAAQGVAAAIAMQRESENPIQGQRLFLRIGVNFGRAIFEHNDVFGEAVNDAAALVKIAKARQIVTNASTIASLSPELQHQCTVFDRVILKGGNREEDILLVSWEQTEQAGNSNATVVGALAFDKNLLVSLKLLYMGKTYVVSLDKTPFHIGRDPDQCQLAIDSHFASRAHVCIEFRRGKFVLVDHSTNGTYVQMSGSPTLYLRREELPLAGRGYISVGQPLGTALDLMIEFQL